MIILVIDDTIQQASLVRAALVAAEGANPFPWNALLLQRFLLASINADIYASSITTHALANVSH